MRYADGQDAKSILPLARTWSFIDTIIDALI